jgi:RNA-directed DNA polymerase
VVLARYQTRRLTDWIEGTLEGRFRLTINRDKTRIVKMRQPGASLTFLGFTLRYDHDRYGRGRTFLNVFPSAKAQARAREKLRELTGRHRRSAPIPEVIDEVNRWLVGWRNYFRHGHPGRVFASLNCFVQNRMRRHLQRRSQRHLRPPEGVSFYAYLQRLGLRRLRATRC